MKTLTKYENLKEMEVAELYESIFKDEDIGVEGPTYGVKIRNIILDDINGHKPLVEGFTKAINLMLEGNQEAKELIKGIINESLEIFEKELIDL